MIYEVPFGWGVELCITARWRISGNLVGVRRVSRVLGSKLLIKYNCAFFRSPLPRTLWSESWFVIAVLLREANHRRCILCIRIPDVGHHRLPGSKRDRRESWGRSRKTAAADGSRLSMADSEKND